MSLSWELIEENLIETATRTKNCSSCGDKGHLCGDCLDSFLILLEEVKKKNGV